MMEVMSSSSLHYSTNIQTQDSGASLVGHLTDVNSEQCLCQLFFFFLFHINKDIVFLHDQSLFCTHNEADVPRNVVSE